MRRTRDTRGNFAILFAVILTALLGFAAIAIDLSYVRNARMQMSNAVDAAAHAAMLVYRETTDEGVSTAKAVEIAGQNKVGDKYLTLSPSDVVFGRWDFESRVFSPGGEFINAVQVRGYRSDENSTDGPLNLFFAPFIGRTTAVADATATGAFRFREIMIVQDTTGTFMEEIDDARTAAVALLDYVYANQFPQDKMGMVLFANAGLTWDDLKNIDSHYNDLRSHWVGNGVTTCTDPDNCRFSRCADFNGYNDTGTTYTGPTGLTICHKVGNTDCDEDEYQVCCREESGRQNEWAAPFTKGDDNLACDEGAIGTEYPENEGTAPGAGLRLAREELQSAGAPGNVKVIVMISDGKPQCSVGTGEQMSDPCPQGRYDDALDEATLAEEAGISIYTVALCSGCNSTQMSQQVAFMEAITRGSGRTYTTTDSSELEGILIDIGKSLPVAIVE